MDYEGVICRPPMELGAFLLPVTVGCTHNRCTFCTFYKDTGFRIIPLEAVEAELARAAGSGRTPRRIFLGDGNPFTLAADRLMEILTVIRRYFPAMPPVCMDATVANIAAKSDGELSALAEAGVEELYVGLECGVEETLAKLQKGFTLEQAQEQAARLDRAGIACGAHLMLGTGGAGRGKETALRTAALLNEIRPKDAINVEMFIHRGTELYQQVQAGEFQPAGALESLEEERLLLENIHVPMKYDGFHGWHEFHVWGPLPEKGPAMLKKLDGAIAQCRRELESPGVQTLDELQRVRIHYDQAALENAGQAGA